MKNAVSQILLLLVTMILMLVAGEVSLIFLDYRPIDKARFAEQNVYMRSANPDRVYEFEPGAEGLTAGTKVTINSAGYRGPVAQAGEFSGERIILLGDSITFGYGLPVEQSYAGLLQQNLQEAGELVEVINLGVPAYNTLQEVSMLKDMGLNYEPDLIILGFCLNDLRVADFDLDAIERYQTRSGGIYNLNSAMFLLEKLDLIRLRYFSDNYNSTESFRARFGSRLSPIDTTETELLGLMSQAAKVSPVGEFRKQERVEMMRYAFEWLAQLSAQHEFDVVVAIFPVLDEENGEYPHESAHAIVTKEAMRVGFDVLDFQADFMSVGMESLRMSRRDRIHPTAEGHRIIADRLTQELLER